MAVNTKSRTGTCESCNTLFVKSSRISLRSKTGKMQHDFDREQRFCNRECVNNAQRTGYIDKNGYQCFNVAGKQTFEHRTVMESILGRKLLPRETVHHKNGIRNDNRPGNLELWSNRHGKGQRVEEKVEYALEVLRLYAPHLLKNGSAECDVISMTDFINGSLSMAS